MTDFESTYRRHNELRAKSSEANKAVLFDALQNAGITRVVVGFDGAGDSGQIEAVTSWTGDHDVELPAVKITVQRSDWGSSELVATETSLAEAIEYQCYGCLEQTHPGWENNDGAYGEFTFDVTARRITLDFSGRFTDVWTDQHTF